MRNPQIHARPGAALAPMPPAASDHPGRLRGVRDRSLAASMAFVATVAAIAVLAGSQAIAVYALGFWHYLLYALAYRFGAVPLPTFKRDAVLMKSVALLAVASAYFTAALDPVSLAVVASGFLLNALGAAVLGADRTYYGHEVAGLPRLRVARFPYSAIAHPMLVGNMLAHGGMLLNPGFREHWWPLACAHVALNLGLLAMERFVMPLRLAANGAAVPRRRGAWARVLAACAVGAASGFAIGWLAGFAAPPLAGALGAAIGLYAATLHAAYTAPAPPRGARLPS